MAFLHSHKKLLGEGCSKILAERTHSAGPSVVEKPSSQDVPELLRAVELKSGIQNRIL